MQVIRGATTVTTDCKEEISLAVKQLFAQFFCSAHFVLLKFVFFAVICKSAHHVLHVPHGFGIRDDGQNAVGG